MKRKIVGAFVASGVILTASTAWALLSGLVSVPNAVQGLSVGGGSSACQNTGVDFTIPDPTWQTSISDYGINSIDYSGVTASCVSLGTADLLVTVTVSGLVMESISSLNMTATSGTLTFSSPMSFDDASSASYNFLVKDA